MESEIRRLLKDVPDMPATVIPERIGWERAMTVLRDRIAQLRPLFMPPDPGPAHPGIGLVSWPGGICGSRMCRSRWGSGR